MSKWGWPPLMLIAAGLFAVSWLEDRTWMRAAPTTGDDGGRGPSATS